MNDVDSLLIRLKGAPHNKDSDLLEQIRKRLLEQVKKDDGVDQLVSKIIDPETMAWFSFTEGEDGSHMAEEDGYDMADAGAAIFLWAFLLGAEWGMVKKPGTIGEPVDN